MKKDSLYKAGSDKNAKNLKGGNTTPLRFVFV